MLNHIQRTFNRFGFAIEKRLFVYQNPVENVKEYSGLRATIFGATGTSNDI